MITYLPATTPPLIDLPDIDGANHPMREVTEQSAFDRATWTPQRAQEVTEFFDDIAPGWNTRIPQGEMAGVPDALERGVGRFGGRGGLCVEVGAGTGRATGYLAEWFDAVVALDISQAMLAQLESAPRAAADGARLPCADGVADAVALANMFLFPDEVKRVLKPGGLLIWYNSVGARTPIHLSDEQLLAALGDGWRGVASTWSHATWCVLKSPE